jgi:hypothetical protein
VDAVVLAGTHQDKRRLIQGHNKAFLPLGDRPCLHYVLEALRGSERVERIFVVGPSEDLGRRLPPAVHGYEPVGEKGRMLDNAFEAYRTADASLLPRAVTEGGGGSIDNLYLFITADVPLAVPEAINDFVDRGFARERELGERIDFFAGVADEVGLAPFYPGAARRGIYRPYMELKHQRLRLANIYLARPARIRNLEILQQGFAARKLTQWRSVLRLIRTFLGNPAGLRGAGHVVCLQAVSVLDRAGLHPLARVARNRLDLAVIERTASSMLGCHFRSLITPFGGLSLDIDDESDYQIIRDNLEVWREHQRGLLPFFPEEALPPEIPEIPAPAQRPQPTKPATGKPAN